MQIRLLVGAALAASLVAGPLQAQSAEPYEVVRMNDGAMTCEALVGAINTLSQEVRQQAANAERAQRNRQTAGAVGRGLLGGLARGASLFGGGNGGNEAAVVGALAGMASEAAAAGNAAPAQPPAAAAPTPQAERLAHLNDLFRNRSC